MSAPSTNDDILACTHPGHTQEKLPFTRAEKRRFAREKHAPQAPQAILKRKQPPAKKESAAIDISKLSATERDTYIALLEAKACSGGTKSKTLADRITHDKVKKEQAGEKPKKELSAAKLEKIEKRRQIRAERKAAWEAKKAAENPEGAEAALPAASAAAAPAKSPARIPSSRRLEVAPQPPVSAPASRRASVAARSPARTRSRSASKAPETQLYAEDSFEDLEY